MVRLIEYLAAGVVDSSGSIVASGTVTFYDAGTTSLRTVYEDYELATPHSNPATLDAAGRLFAFADRRVKVVIQDSDGNDVKTIDDVGGTSAGDISTTDIADNAITSAKLDDSSIASVSNGSALSISAAYTVTDTDGVGLILATTGASGFTVTLPTASANTNRVLTIKKVDSGAGVVTADGEGTETIDGETTLIIPRQYSSATLFCNGVGWNIIGRQDLNVVARYETNAQQTITNNTNIRVDYEDLLEDSHSAVTTGTWAFTAPRNGFYHVTASVELDSAAGWESGEVARMAVYKGGAEENILNRFTYQASLTSDTIVNGSTIVQMDKDDVIYINVSQNNDANINLKVGTTANFVTIVSLD